MDYADIDDSLFYIDEFLWRLDVPRYELSDEILTFLSAADRLQEEHLSLRGLAKETGIPKSTMQDFIRNKMGYYCSELKQLVKNQLRWNKRNSNTFKIRKF